MRPFVNTVTYSISLEGALKGGVSEGVGPPDGVTAQEGDEEDRIYAVKDYFLQGIQISVFFVGDEGSGVPASKYISKTGPALSYPFSSIH